MTGHMCYRRWLKQASSLSSFKFFDAIQVEGFQAWISGSTGKTEESGDPDILGHLIETLDVARHTCWMKKVENISFLQARNAGILTTTQKEIAVESYLFCHLRSNIKVRFEMSGDNFQLTSNKWQPWRIHGADVQMVLPNVKWGTAADYHNNLSEFIKCLGTMGDETVWNILYMDHLGKTTPKTVSDKQNHSHSETRQGLSHVWQFLISTSLLSEQPFPSAYGGPQQLLESTEEWPTSRVLLPLQVSSTITLTTSPCLEFQRYSFVELGETMNRWVFWEMKTLAQQVQNSFLCLCRAKAYTNLSSISTFGHLHPPWEELYIPGHESKQITYLPFVQECSQDQRLKQSAEQTCWLDLGCQY